MSELDHQKIAEELREQAEKQKEATAKLKYMDKIFGRSALGPHCSGCGGRGYGTKGICPKCHGTGRPY